MNIYFLYEAFSIYLLNIKNDFQKSNFEMKNIFKWLVFINMKQTSDFAPWHIPFISYLQSICTHTPAILKNSGIHLHDKKKIR